MKSEPISYSIDHLKADKKTPWNGVRNFQARNYMREMTPGDTIFFYHSSCPKPGIYGLAKVASKPYPDETQFDAKSTYFERRATKEKPVWDLVDIAFVKKLREPLLIGTLRENTKLASLKMLEPGSRLSVTPVSEAEARELLRVTG